MKKILIAILLVMSTLSFGEVYYGNIHAHTSYSDGMGTPEQAFLHARNSGVVDIQGITDHDHDLNYPLPDGSLKLDVIRAMAKKYTTEGEFIAISGFEWTLTSQGHITIYDTTDWIDRSRADLYGIYDWIVEHEATAQFCHPGQKYGDFFDFEYYPEVDLYINTIEVGNGAGKSNNVIKPEYFERYQRALARGWHVGASANQDNHQENWATANDARTAFVIDELSSAKVYEALKTRNIYATEDRNALISLSSGSSKMGDIIYDTPSATLSISYSDPGEAVTSAYIYSNSGIWKLDVSGDAWESQFKVENALSYNWYFLKVNQADGNEIVSSPVWFQSSSNQYLLNARTTQARPVKGLPFEIEFDLVNASERERTMPVSVVAGGERIFSREYPVPAMTCVEIRETIYSSSPDLTFYVQAERAFDLEIDFVAFSVNLDTTHENYFVSELKPLTRFLEGLGGEVKPVIGELTSERMRIGQALVLPLPDADSFMKDFMALSQDQIVSIIDYVRRGGLLIIVLAKKEIEPESLASYNQLLEGLPSPVNLKNGGTAIEGNGAKNFDRENGGVVILDWAMATGEESLPEDTTQYMKLKLGLDSGRESD